jgi:hypothetical protein
MYVLRATVNIDWLPDGGGPVSQSVSQTLGFVVGLNGNVAPIAVIGGDTMVSGDIADVATKLGQAVQTYYTANLALLQSWSTGGPAS